MFNSLLSQRVLSTRGSLSRIFSTIRGFAQAAAESSTSSPSEEAVRKTVKHIDSRKTYLIDRYAYLLRNRPVQIYVQHNNFRKDDSFNVRSQFKKLGVQYTVLNTALFKVTLRGIQHPDPASWEARRKYRWPKKRDMHPAMRLVEGPTAVLSFEGLDPALIGSAVEVVEKSGGRLVLMGAVIENKLFSGEELDAVKNLGSFDQVRAELAGVLEVLRGAGLVNTLSSASTGLYLTLEARKQQLEEGNGEEAK
ncbi:hypothetical protein BZA70DRAFT_186835 [Myxozyma melibiosi]|uniref:Ribosomal protein L10 n=1 Tax=Myxozyma melibiosi TaxID=54550 RepID=A0ABR1F4Y4_9ASCO